MAMITESKDGGNLQETCNPAGNPWKNDITMEQGPQMATVTETKEGANIWLRSSCAAPVQGVGGERGQEWLYDTFIR